MSKFLLSLVVEVFVPTAVPVVRSVDEHLEQWQGNQDRRKGNPVRPSPLELKWCIHQVDHKLM